MKNILFIFIFELGLIASEYAVVISAQSPISEVSSKQIKDIFMQKRNFLSNIKIVPVNANASSPVRELFEKRILKIPREKLNKYWVRQHFQGVRPPIVQSSNESIQLFIQNVEGAIGYIPIKYMNENMRILYEF